MLVISSVIKIWVIAYIIPIAAAGGFALVWWDKDDWLERSLVAIHVALIACITITQYAIYLQGLTFPWYPGLFSVAIFVASGILAVMLLGAIGALYFVSAFVQELAMLSLAFFLLHSFPVWPVILFVAPVFVACHFLTSEYWQLKLVLVSLWSVAVILLFVLTHNVYLIAALHTLFGSLLFSRSVLTMPSWSSTAVFFARR